MTTPKQYPLPRRLPSEQDTPISINPPPKYSKPKAVPLPRSSGPSTPISISPPPKYPKTRAVPLSGSPGLADAARKKLVMMRKKA